jgi:hypothetical protein
MLMLIVAWLKMTGGTYWKGLHVYRIGPPFQPNPKYYESDRCRSRSRSSISFDRFFRRAAKRRADAQYRFLLSVRRHAALQQPTAALPTAVLPTAAPPTAIEANAYIASIQQFCLPCLHAAAPVPEATALWERIRQLHHDSDPNQFTY